MERITRDMCVRFIKEHHSSNVWFVLALLVTATIFVWWTSENLIAVLIAVAILSVVLVLVILRARRKIQDIDLDKLYLVVDEVEAFKKQYVPSKTGGRHRYVYTLREHGDYIVSKGARRPIDLTFYRGHGVSWSEIEALTAQSCEEGSRFYLLILKDEGEERIVIGFPKRYFVLAEEEFVLTDGKYYCKK